MSNDEFNQFKVFVSSLSVRNARKRSDDVAPTETSPAEPIPRDVFERIQKFHNAGGRRRQSRSKTEEDHLLRVIIRYL